MSQCVDQPSEYEFSTHHHDYTSLLESPYCVEVTKCLVYLHDSVRMNKSFLFCDSTHTAMQMLGGAKRYPGSQRFRIIFYRVCSIKYEHIYNWSRGSALRVVPKSNILCTFDECRRRKPLEGRLQKKNSKFLNTKSTKN